MCASMCAFFSPACLKEVKINGATIPLLILASSDAVD